MDLDVVNPHVPEKKHKRSEFVESLENFKFDMNPSFSFYNSIDVPSTSQQLAWPDLLTAPTTDESSSYDLPAYSFDLSPPPALAIPTATAVSSVAACAPLESDVNHVRIQQLKSKEQAYRDTLQKLYEEYNPGNALDEVQQVEECVRGELSSIDSMLEQSVLKVDDLFCALSLKDKYQRVLHHCSILESEELYHMDDSNADPEQLVSLEWVEQPLGKSFKNKNRARATKKKKKGHVNMTAQLVCAPGVTFSPSSLVTASFYQVEDDDVVIRQTKTKKRAAASLSVPRGGSGKGEHERSEELSDIQIQNNEGKLVDGRVSFDFRFPAGTRNKPCLIRLHVKGVVTMPDGSRSNVELVSRPTHHIIVTTNESQYETSELKLMMMDLFANGSPTCSWPAFVNALNVRWMRVTRQELESGIAVVSDRTLSNNELEFVASFFRNAPRSVSRDEVVAFYSFFGKATHHFRHNLAFRQLLLDGVVWGFASKAQAEKALQSVSCPTGTFLIRASESNPGSFCLSWTIAGGAVQHALLDAKLLAPPLSAFAECLIAKSFLSHLAVRRQGDEMVVRRKEDALRTLLSVPHTAAPAEHPRAGYLDLELL